MKSKVLKAVGRGTALLAVAAFVAVGCGSDNGSKSSDSKDSKSDSAMSDKSGGDDAMKDGAKTSVISSPGVDLRVTLDRLLAEHASLAYVALTKTIAGEADAGSVVTGLQGNTDDLTAAIASVYGDEAGAAFKSQWEAHIGFFVAYATGVAKKDDAMKAKAAKDLAGYQVSFAKFLNTATGLDAKAAEGALGMHVKQLVGAVDAFGAGDYEKSYSLEREAYAHMFGTGDALSGAITTQKPDDFGYGDVTQAAADTRVLVDQQLAEHAFLAALATTKSLAGAKDATAAVGALDANSNDLGATIGSVYGPEAQKAFLSQWKAHIGFFVDYTVGLATDDKAKTAKAGKDLAGYTEGFSQFLATATDGDQAAYKAALDMHVTQLAGALDAAKAGDADKAWGLAREAYAHMYDTGDALTTAIVTQNPDKFGGEGDAMSAKAKGGDAMGEGEDAGGDAMGDK